eukprot:g5977.t1
MEGMVPTDNVEEMVLAAPVEVAGRTVPVVVTEQMARMEHLDKMGQLDAMDAMLQVLVPKVATENAAGTGGEEEMEETGVMAGALETLVVAETGLLLN